MYKLTAFISFVKTWFSSFSLLSLHFSLQVHDLFNQNMLNFVLLLVLQVREEINQNDSELLGELQKCAQYCCFSWKTKTT